MHRQASYTPRQSRRYTVFHVFTCRRVKSEVLCACLCLRICSTTLHHLRAQWLCLGNRSRNLKLWRKLSSSLLLVVQSDTNIPATASSLVSSTFAPSVCRPKRPSADVVGSSPVVKKPIAPQVRRDARQIYNPPSGKYSATIGSFNYGEEQFFPSVWTTVTGWHVHGPCLTLRVDLVFRSSLWKAFGMTLTLKDQYLCSDLRQKK